MATTPEGKVKKEVDKLIKKFGAFNYAPTTGGYGKSGFFDRFVLMHGVPIGVELKRDADHMPTRLQTENAIKFSNAGGAVLCIHADNLEVLHRYLGNLAEKGHHLVRPFVWPDKALIDYNNSKEEK